MTKPLPVLTADEAFARNLHPAAAFRAFNIAPGTIRAWASTGAIRAHGIGPRGARLYSIAEVSAHSISTSHRPRVRRMSNDAGHTVQRHLTDGPSFNNTQAQQARYAS